MLRIQKCNSDDKTVSNLVYVAPRCNVPADTEYVVINRQYIFKLARSPDCPQNGIMANLVLRKLMNINVDSLVTVEPLQNIIRTNGHSNLVGFMAMFRMTNPELGPPAIFRHNAAGVVNTLGATVTASHESNLECVVHADGVNAFMTRFESNYNNVRYYIDRVVMTSVNHRPAGDVNYLDYLTLDNKVPTIAKLEIEIPIVDKVAGTFAGLDYALCLRELIQPNLLQLYEYLAKQLSSSVIYDNMRVAVDSRLCFLAADLTPEYSTNMDKTLFFRVRSLTAPTHVMDTYEGQYHVTNAPFGVLAPETEIVFVS